MSLFMQFFHSTLRDSGSVPFLLVLGFSIHRICTYVLRVFVNIAMPFSLFICLRYRFIVLSFQIYIFRTRYLSELDRGMIPWEFVGVFSHFSPSPPSRLQMGRRAKFSFMESVMKLFCSPVRV